MELEVDPSDAVARVTVRQREDGFAPREAADPAMPHGVVRWRSCSPPPPLTQARSVSSRTSGRLAGAVGVYFGIAGDFVPESRLGQQLVQPSDLRLQFAQAPDVKQTYTANLSAAQMQKVRGLADAVSAENVLCRHAGFRLTQEVDDRFFGRVLLHLEFLTGGAIGLNTGVDTQNRDAVGYDMRANRTQQPLCERKFMTQIITQQFDCNSFVASH